MKNHRIAKKFISLALVALMLLPFPAYATESGGEQKSVCEFCGQSYPSLVKHECPQVMCLYCHQSFDRNTGHTCTATTYTCACGKELMQNTYHTHYNITCQDCGETYADYEKHNCQNFATITCDKCGESYMDQPGWVHYCPTYCDGWGAKSTPLSPHSALQIIGKPVRIAAYAMGCIRAIPVPPPTNATIAVSPL